MRSLDIGSVVLLRAHQFLCATAVESKHNKSGSDIRPSDFDFGDVDMAVSAPD